jgi:hypothetical protein
MRRAYAGGVSQMAGEEAMAPSNRPLRRPWLTSTGVCCGDGAGVFWSLRFPVLESAIHPAGIRRDEDRLAARL